MLICSGLESHRRKVTLLTKKDSYHSRRRSCRVSNDAASGSTSLRLDFGRSDHLAPFLGFFDDELAEGGGRAHKRGFAQIRKVRIQLRSALISALSLSATQFSAAAPRLCCISPSGFPESDGASESQLSTKNSSSSSFCRLKISIQAVMELVLVRLRDWEAYSRSR